MDNNGSEKKTWDGMYGMLHTLPAMPRVGKGPGLWILYVSLGAYVLWDPAVGRKASHRIVCRHLGKYNGLVTTRILRYLYGSASKCSFHERIIRMNDDILSSENED